VLHHELHVCFFPVYLLFLSQRRPRSCFEMADCSARGIEIIKLCRSKPLTDAQHSSIMALLNDGADLSVRYGPGNTALHYAAEKGHSSIVKELLAKGADHSCANSEGKTPIDLARSTGNSDIAKVLDAFASKKKQTASSKDSSAAEAAAAPPAALASPSMNVTEADPAGAAADSARPRESISLSEREAFENMVATTLASPLPPGVDLIGCVQFCKYRVSCAKPVPLQNASDTHSLPQRQRQRLLRAAAP
jgi:hypothetical protein